MSDVPYDKPVSRFLSSSAITLRDDLTVDQALAQLRRQPMAGESQIVYFYVIDAAGKLVGVLPTRRLLLSPAGAAIRDLVAPGLITLRESDTLFDALELFAMHRLLAIPVVDRAGKFLGILDVSTYTDEVYDLAQNRQLNEVFQLIGLHLEEFRHGSPLKGLRVRLPWLLCNIVGGLACAGLGALFDQVVQQFIILALFIPMILTLAESLSVQSMTLAIEAAASKSKSAAGLMREALTALLLGVGCGLLVAGISLFWKQPLIVPAVIGGSVMLSMFFAGLLGRAVPKLIYLLKLNPRIASGPVTLAAVDVMTVTVYLSAATLFLLKH